MIREQFIQRLGAACAGIGQDHILDDGQTLGLKEHVLGAAQTDALRAVRTGAARVLRIIRIGPHLQFGNIIRPVEQGQQVGLLLERGRAGGNFTEEDLARRAVHGHPLAFGDRPLADDHQAAFHVNFHGGRADHRGDAKLARHHRRVGGRAAFAGEDTFRGDHAMHIVGLGEWAHHDDILLAFLRHFLGGIRVEIDLADGRAGRGVDALRQHL